MSKPYGLLADLHLHPWSSFSHVLPTGVNSRLQMLLDEIDRAAAEVKAAGGDTLIWAGDVFHIRGSVAPSVFNATRDALRDIGYKHGVHVVIMPGNHDLEGRESTRLGSAVTGLEMSCDMDGIGGVAVINDVHLHHIHDGQSLILVPWVEDIATLKVVLQEVERRWEGQLFPPKRAECDLIIHAPIDGVIEGLPHHGLDPDFLAGLGFKRVFAGHYHNHRQMHPGVAVPRGPERVLTPDEKWKPEEFDCYGEVWSIGALAHHTWSDVGSRAGFLIVGDEVTWRKSHLPEFVDVGKALEFCTPEELPFVVDGNYVRVRVEASKVKEVEAAKKELLDMGARAVLVQAEPKAPAREGTTVATVSAGASLEVQVGEFVAKGIKPELAEAVSKAAMDVLAAAGVEA